MRAEQTMTPFHITEQDIRAVWPSNGLCPVFGMPLESGVGFSHDGSPTLDRLNSAWGYERGNIAVISHKANRAKSGLTAFFISKSDLIASKLAAGRLRDLADVEEIRESEASQPARGEVNQSSEPKKIGGPK